MHPSQPHFPQSICSGSRKWWYTRDNLARRERNHHVWLWQMEFGWTELVKMSRWWGSTDLWGQKKSSDHVSCKCYWKAPSSVSGLSLSVPQRLMLNAFPSFGIGVVMWELILPGRVPGSIPIEFTQWNSLQIEKRNESVASAVQTSLLLMNYSRTHFRGNEILNEVLRTSSAECMAEFCKVIDLNGKSVGELMKREKNSEFTWIEGETEVRW